LKQNFLKEIESIKTRYKLKDGSISKKLELSISIAQNEIGDYIYSKWEEYYKTLNNKEQLLSVQKSRGQIAKKIKQNTAELKKAFEQSDMKNVDYQIGHKYNYKNSKGINVIVKIKEVSSDGKRIEKVIDDKKNIFKPYQDNIGDRATSTTK